jgi:hypothetical protein
MRESYFGSTSKSPLGRENLNNSALSPANNTHSFISGKTTEKAFVNRNLDNSYDNTYAPTTNNNNNSSEYKIFHKLFVIALSPNNDRLKNLCDKLAGLGSNLEENKQVFLLTLALMDNIGKKGNS